jgi:T5orf172 domain
MLSSSRIISRRLPNPPTPCPTDQALVPMYRGIASKTPPPRPIPYSNISANSASSTGSSTDNDTIFDLSYSRSWTPTSPLTPGEISPSFSSRSSFGIEIANRSTVRSLTELPLDLQTAETSLYEILSEVAASINDTPSKRKIGIPEQRQSRIPGIFESQDTDTDMGAEYFSFDPSTPSGDESARLVDEARQILGGFAKVPTAAFLLRRVQQLRPADWKCLANIYKEHSRATHDLQQLIQVLRIRTHSHPSILNPLTVLDPALTLDNPPKSLNFVPWKPEKRLRQINNDIYKCIWSHQIPGTRSIKRATGKSNPSPGWVYIYESPVSAPGKVKIGKTDSDPQERMAQWGKCGVPLKEVDDSCRNAFDHFSMVESLIKFELHNERKKYKCYGKTHAPKKWVEHGEWFEIDKQKALNCVRRWRNWLKDKEPLDENGVLTPYWHWRAQKLPKFINDVNWDAWTQPSLFDYIDYQLEEFGRGYYARLKGHLCRKDFHFCLTGGMMTYILFTQFGMVGVIWGLLALVAL